MASTPSQFNSDAFQKHRAVKCPSPFDSPLQGYTPMKNAAKTTAKLINGSDVTQRNKPKPSRVYWEFLGGFLDLTSKFGLFKLEEYLQNAYKESMVKKSNDIIRKLSIEQTKNKLSMANVCITDEDSDGEEMWYTPPQSPSQWKSVDKGESTIYIKGNKHTQIDAKLYQSLKNVTVNPQLYPRIQEWKLAMDKHSKGDEFRIYTKIHTYVALLHKVKNIELKKKRLKMENNYIRNDIKFENELNVDNNRALMGSRISQVAEALDHGETIAQVEADQSTSSSSSFLRASSLSYPYIFNGDIFQVQNRNGYNIIVKCIHCSGFYKGSLRSTGNFHMHIRRRHPNLLNMLHKMRMEAITKKSNQLKVVRKSKIQLSKSNHRDKMPNASNKSEFNEYNNFNECVQSVDGHQSISPSPAAQICCPTPSFPYPQDVEQLESPLQVMVTNNDSSVCPRNSVDDNTAVPLDLSKKFRDSQDSASYVQEQSNVIHCTPASNQGRFSSQNNQPTNATNNHNDNNNNNNSTTDNINNNNNSNDIESENDASNNIVRSNSNGISDLVHALQGNTNFNATTSALTNFSSFINYANFGIHLSEINQSLRALSHGIYEANQIARRRLALEEASLKYQHPGFRLPYN